jgi:outer membrane biosynthesis protein TonB
MKLSTGKRIGQSGQELLTAAVFSFVLHVCAVAAVALFYISFGPKVYLPPVYNVKLVGLPAGVPAVNTAPQTAPAPAAPAPQAAKPAPKPKQQAPPPPKAPAQPSPNAVPELGKAKSKPEHKELPKSAEPPPKPAPAPSTAQQQAPAPAGSAPSGAASGAKSEGVAVASAQQDFKFGWYLSVVRDKISQNWSPPPDAPDAKAHVVFSVNRSGWVEAVNIDKAKTNATYAFELAAMRAIQASNPFPPLPEDFFRQTLEFSVDLTPKE